MSSSSNSFAWWQTGVVYQIYPRSFKDSNGDGIGDLQGIIDKMDYLNDGTPNSLGVDAIWISPIFPSPMADFGYDVSDYVDIHPMFGDLATFDRLLAEAHKRDIRVILDFVPNHTSDEHPWFVEARSTHDNPKRDWYIWRDAKPDGSLPNNWVSMFGGKAWTWDEKTQQYYLHLFHTKQPDLNWRNPDVKTAMLEVLRFWLDRGVDGFRMDVVGFTVKDTQLRDNPQKPDIANDRWEHQEHIHDIDQPEVHDIIREFRTLHEQYDDRVIIGEIWAEPRTRWVQYYGQKLDGLHLPFNFDLLNKPWNAAAMRASVDELEVLLPEGAWPNYVLGSHDISRLATRYGEHAVRLAAMMLLTLRGTPTMYMGDELGMADGRIPVEQIQDPQGLNMGPEASRDPCRTPFQWSTEKNVGFSDVTPWLPIAAGHELVNVAMQHNDPTSILSLYRNLLHYRKKTAAINRGTYISVDVPGKDCFVYVREYNNQRYLIALNFADEQIELDLHDVAAVGQIVISTESQCNKSHHTKLSIVSLRPYEGIIWEL
jgi:alpha-glucosidase